MYLVTTVLICSTSLVLSSTVRSTRFTTSTTPPVVKNTTIPDTSTVAETTVATTQTCTDRIGNCVSYGSKICTGTYQEWAEINCKDFCGLCVDTVLVPTPGPLAPSPGSCADEIGNCNQYDKTICNGAYHVWAKQHCADFCGFCSQTSISTKPHIVYSNAVSWPTSQTNTACKDYSTQCAKYGSASKICHEPYVAWAQTNCAAYCGYCGGITKPAINTHCLDKLLNCQAYGKYACQGNYVEWASHNCASYCGLCGAQLQVTKPVYCVDKISNCNQYTQKACVTYAHWASQNCANFCGLCSVILLTTTSVVIANSFYYGASTEPTTLMPIHSKATMVPTTQKCTDEVGNCVSYGSKICTGIYQKWAEINCKDFCGLCVDTVLVPTTGQLVPFPGVCADEIGNCRQYDKTICNGAYHVWAKQHCAAYCGFCSKQMVDTQCTDKSIYCAYSEYSCLVDSLKCARHCGLCDVLQSSIEATTPSVSTVGSFLTTTTKTCTDRVGNCVSYGSKICTGTYQKWAEINCKDFCGLCVDTVLVPTPGPLAPSPGSCADEINNCKQYDKTICSGAYHVWAKLHCANFCGFCTDQVTKPAAYTDCTDKMKNCKDYGRYVCQAPYLTWAKDNCADYCGFCGGHHQTTKPVPCIDKLPNCAAHTKAACEGVYVTWAKEHCARFCGLCDGTSSIIVG